MPLDLLAISAAFISGLMGSVHCMAMCGGIATGLASTGGAPRRAAAALADAFQWNVGRVGGYVVAGALAGAMGGGLLRMAGSPALQAGLRVALGVAMMLVALRVAGRGDRWNPLARAGAPAWRALAPLRQRVVPANTLPRRLLLGVLWGWLPCGLSSGLLVVAWLQADAIGGALVMAAFGAGTLPAMVPLAWSGSRLGAPTRPRARHTAATAVFAAGVLTAAGPWLVHVPAMQRALVALGCRSAW